MMNPGSALRGLGLGLLFATLLSCGGQQAIAPVGRQAGKPSRMKAVTPLPDAPFHRVRRGESLYAIAWVYGLDYRDIAAWNRIAEPYTIYPGQRLRLRPLRRRRPVPGTAGAKSRQHGTRARQVLRPAPAGAVKNPPGPVARTTAKTARPAVKKTTPNPGAVVKKWRWPATGKVIGSFNKSGGKGINIRGRRGQPVYTAAPGRVVYSGSGLRGYGKLIIIKHNKRFLSAYAHNQRLRVREGDTVKTGQQIAEMGDTESREIKLHFEIRRDGRPVDPIRYLPRS